MLPQKELGAKHISPFMHILYHKMDSMIVDEHTAISAIARFLEKASYNFFNKCSLCGDVKVGPMVCCAACAVCKLCDKCSASCYNAETTLLDRCPGCSTVTRSHRTRRFVDIPGMGWKVKQGMLLLCQTRATIPADTCVHCRKKVEDGAKRMLRCTCALSTPYCSAECQKADWKLHQRECKDASCDTGNVAEFLIEWYKGNKGLTISSLQSVASTDIVFEPLTAVLILNWARARRADELRRQRHKSSSPDAAAAAGNETRTDARALAIAASEAAQAAHRESPYYQYEQLQMQLQKMGLGNVQHE